MTLVARRDRRWHVTGVCREAVIGLIIGVFAKTEIELHMWCGSLTDLRSYSCCLS